jgi:hypothetical protein
MIDSMKIFLDGIEELCWFLTNVKISKCKPNKNVETYK